LAISRYKPFFKPEIETDTMICPFCDHKNAPGATRCASCKAELPRPEEVDDVSTSGPAHSLDGRVLALMREGRKIEAIKLYRDLTGAGLGEAKNAVEALEREDSRPQKREARSDDGEILELLRDGQKIRAIKLYRDRTGAGLKEAKDAVEALARSNGIPAGSSGCASAVLALALFGSVACCLLL
jgi:ribosomal protein L7/L12